MKTMLTLLVFCTLQIAAFSQTTSTWIGGTPGMATEWNCPTNWKEGRVPDENAQVIIPSDLIFYPVIKGEVPEIDALLVTGGAQLTIKDGSSLTILGDTGRLDVLTVQGKLVKEGLIYVKSWEKLQICSRN